MKKTPDEKLADEAYAILLELAQTNDHEFPYIIPELIDRARKLITQVRAEVRHAHDGKY